MEMKEGVKNDQGKSRYDLIPPYPLELLAQVYTMGAQKYEDHNWTKGIKYSRVFAAIMRHLWAFWRGENEDPESGLPHPVHAAWGCFTLLYYMRYRRDYDDRIASDSFIKAFSGIQLDPKRVGGIDMDRNGTVSVTPPSKVVGFQTNQNKPAPHFPYNPPAH